MAKVSLKPVEMAISKHTLLWKCSFKSWGNGPGHYFSSHCFLHIHFHLPLYNFHGKTSEWLKNRSWAINKFTQRECKFPPFYWALVRGIAPRQLSPAVSKLEIALKSDTLPQKSLPALTTWVSELVINLVETIWSSYDHY